MPRGVKREESEYFGGDVEVGSAQMPKRGRRAAAVRAKKAVKENVEEEEEDGNGELLEVEDVKMPATTTEPIEVKTKFPVARIKRIMQADDDVGKVAQVTPVVVCEFLPFLAYSLFFQLSFQ